ncbi:SDR family NAD(P)-dependent oxidoreductase [Verminephrobacter eiseniae]|uniref:SDR family NAD(P)-dependent oxidoreductase n=1 Tax=Verminephrobacter eiseniae TaxID=364317 RepID=UPI0022384012|nr:SDR family oxidoreductase [Verminephrobacter eiseniae]
MTTMDMTGRKVLITGAAGGLGSAITWAFARAGAQVHALDIDTAKGERLLAAGSDEAAAVRERVRFVRADLSDARGLGQQLAVLFEEIGGIDVLINNAAIYPSRAIEDYGIEEHRQVQCVNVDAALVCVQAALPHMKRQQHGRIIDVVSTTMYGGWPLLLPYVTSKGALLGMTRAMARELGPHGITVNAVSPGAFPTDAEKIHPDPQGYERFVLEHQSVKRRGSPDDIANAMLFFAADGSGFVTGQTLNVDGGWVMQ